jgi:hypothetical protein
MNVGGELGIRTRYTCGIPWRTRIDEAHWKSSATRTIGWYGKQKTTNGHMKSRNQGMVANRRRQRDKIQKDKGMLGEIPGMCTKWDTKCHKKHTTVTSTKLRKGYLHHRPDRTRDDILARNGIRPPGSFPL